MTTIFDRIHSQIERVFSENVVYDPSGLAITLKAVTEVEFRPVELAGEIQIPPLAYFTQAELDLKAVVLKKADVIQIVVKSPSTQAINYTIGDIQNDGRGGVTVALNNQTV